MKRYWHHRESDSLFTTDDPSVEAVLECDELDREQYLEVVAYQAMVNSRSNDATMPYSDADCAAEMVEHGVFGPTEDCLDDEGEVLAEYVTAVRRARIVWRYH